MTSKRKFSKKINYNILEDLFEDGETVTANALAREMSSEPRSRAGSVGSQRARQRSTTPSDAGSVSRTSRKRRRSESVDAVEEDYIGEEEEEEDRPNLNMAAIVEEDEPIDAAAAHTSESESEEQAQGKAAQDAEFRRMKEARQGSEEEIDLDI